MDSSFYNIPRNGGGDGMKLKILLLDDEERLCAILRERLAMEGYDVRTANDGRQGLTLYNNSPTDLVITDLLMPEVDGLEVIRTLRGLLAPPLIIAMSGGWSRDWDFLVEATEFGANRTISKPFALDELVILVNDLLSSLSHQNV
jgi:two-component system response regulator (stage 0 sporulation protein F)